MYDVALFAAILCAVIIIPAFLFVSFWADTQIKRLRQQLQMSRQAYEGLLRDFEGARRQYHELISQRPR